VFPVYAVFMRDFVDSAREQIYVRQTIKNELIKFTFILQGFHRISSDLGQSLARRNALPRRNNRSGSLMNILAQNMRNRRQEVGIQSLLSSSNHDLLMHIRQLYSLGGKDEFDQATRRIVWLHKSDLLMPFNKTTDYLSSKSREIMITMFILMTYICSMSWFLNYAIYSSLIIQRNPRYRTNFRFIDILVDYEVIAMGSWVALAAALHSVALTIGNKGELDLVSFLCKLTSDCVQVNEAKIGQMMGVESSVRTMKSEDSQHVTVSLLTSANDELNSEQRGSSRCQQLLDECNTNLLLVLLHYKIYLHNFKTETQRSLKIFVIPIAFGILLSLLTRLNSPYLVRVAEKNNLLTQAYLLSALVPIDLALVPLCHLHSKCLDLHKKLSYLLAHSIRVDEIYARSFKIRSGQSNAPMPITAYNRAVISMLRKELSYPERFQREHVVRHLGIACTYDHILSGHFWFGIVILSAMYGHNFGPRELLGSLFDYGNT